MGFPSHDRDTVVRRPARSPVGAARRIRGSGGRAEGDRDGLEGARPPDGEGDGLAGRVGQRRQHELLGGGGGLGAAPRCEDGGMSTGTLVLAATPIGDPRDAAPRLGAGARHRRRRRSRGHPPPAPAARPTSGSRRRARSSAITSTTRPPARPTSSSASSRASASSSSPTPVCRPSRTPATASSPLRSRRASASPASRDRARSSWRSPCRACPSTGSASTASSRASRGSAPGCSPTSPRSGAPSSSSRRPTGSPRPWRRCADAFGADRRAAVCRELTKTYEEVRRGTLSELVEWAEAGVRGEITIVVAGAERVVTSIDEARCRHPGAGDAGERLKDVAADVAARTGLSKKALYDASVAAR